MLQRSKSQSVENVGAILSDAFERHRLYRAQVCEDTLELWKLLAGNLGETWTHAVILRLSGNDIRNVLTDGGLGTGGRFPIFETLCGECSTGSRLVSNAFGLWIVQPGHGRIMAVLVQDKAIYLSAGILDKLKLRVDGC